MITTIPPQTNEMSTVDALWVLIQSQTKAVQKALIQRILASQTSEKTKAQQKGKVHHDARKLFAK